MISHGIKFNPVERARMGFIACSHPGKMGDALYALPTIRHLARTNKATVDFFTSEYCRPILRLMQNQAVIRDAFILPNYVIENTKCGVQPWRMPIALGNYDKVFHLGFRAEPDRRLDRFIAMQTGISEEHLDGIKYDYMPIETLNEPYIILAPSGKKQHLHMDVLLELLDKSPVTVVQVGGPEEGIKHRNGLDLTGLDMWDTLPWIANSIGFVGLLSANLVLANGFDIPKVCLVPRANYKSHHTIQGELNIYLHQPNLTDILKGLRLS